MLNPFHSMNSAAMTMPELRDCRVDRDTEFEQCKASLLRRSHNVLLYGARGAGKTFLVRLLEDEIRRTADDAFPCLINVASLSGYDMQDEVSAFPKAVLLQICAKLWTELLGHPYLDLRQRLSETGREITFRSQSEKTIQAVYRSLMLHNIVLRSTTSNVAGMNLVAKGEKTEGTSFEAKNAAILPFEFAEFVDQLITDVLVPRGRTRIIVLCDESNHMKLYQQEEILSRYLELFSERHVQFLFVAGIGPWSRQEYVPSCFETTLKLDGFSDRGHVAKLIENALRSSGGPTLSFAPETVDVLFESFSGHPRRTIEACSLAFEAAIESGLSTVDFKLILRSCRAVEEQERRYETLSEETRR